MKHYIIILFTALSLILFGCSDSTSDDPDPVNGGMGEFSVNFGGDWSGNESTSFSAFTLFFDEDEPEVEVFYLFGSTSDFSEGDNGGDMQHGLTVGFYSIGGMISPGTYDIVDGQVIEESGNLTEVLSPDEFVVFIVRNDEQGFYSGFSQSGSITFDSVSENSVSGSFGTEFEIYGFAGEVEVLDVTASGNFSSIFIPSDEAPDL